jgi:hypothetical protein
LCLQSEGKSTVKLGKALECDLDEKEEKPKKKKKESKESDFLRNLRETIGKVEIKIIKHKEISASLNNYIMYTISGKDNEGEFSTDRRYSEFDKLRFRLFDRWPGLFIPNLPEKSVTGNLEGKFIERRKRLLNAFLNRCTDLP